MNLNRKRKNNKEKFNKKNCINNKNKDCRNFDSKQDNFYRQKNKKINKF